jgi:hypothetical protein
MPGFALFVMALTLIQTVRQPTPDLSEDYVLSVSGMTGEQLEKSHAHICAHGPKRFCGPNLKRYDGAKYLLDVPKDAPSGTYTMWLEYDDGKIDLHSPIRVKGIADQHKEQK